MAEKILNTRIIHKHATAEDWSKATNFIPNQGELIVYDIDDNYNYERFKIGDGLKNVNDLPFSDEQNENVQSDWNENDETSDAYIKNRTHYLYFDQVAVTEETTIPDNMGGFGVINAVKDGESCIVNYDGQTYECVPKLDPGGDLSIGNLRLASSKQPDTGESFLFLSVSEQGAWSTAFFSTDGPHTFQIFTLRETAKQIDEKYLPNIQSDWSVNDENDRAYIKNRTHYDESHYDYVMNESTYENATAYRITYVKSLKANQTYTVVCDGQEYQCVPFWNDSLYSYVLGNGALAKIGPDTGEPFFFNCQQNSTMTAVYFADTNRHTIFIHEGYIEDIKKLDSKYLEIATDDDILALMLEENALPVIQDEDGAVLASAENEILFI